MTRRAIGLSVPYRKTTTSVSPTSPKVLQRKWVDLTLADKQSLLDDNYGGSRADVIDRAIKLFKEKNA